MLWIKLDDIMLVTSLCSGDDTLLHGSRLLYRCHVAKHDQILESRWATAVLLRNDPLTFGP